MVSGGGLPAQLFHPRSQVTPDIQLDNIYFNWNAAMEMLVINVLGIFLNIRCNFLCIKE